MLILLTRNNSNEGKNKNRRSTFAKSIYLRQKLQPVSYAHPVQKKSLTWKLKILYRVLDERCSKFWICLEIGVNMSKIFVFWRFIFEIKI